MKKTILRADLLLFSEDRTPGLRGQELLLVQDQIGGHVVRLAPGNEGVIEVGLQPGCVTLMVYRNDESKTYWTSEILTPQLIINQPAKINDLLIYIVDSNGCKLKWTAPQGNPPLAEVAANKYHIYISQSEIDPNYGVQDLPEYKQSLIPKAPGQTEEIVLSQLIPGHKYYVAIIAETIINGKAKVSPLSNIQSFIASANDINGSSDPRIIPINVDSIYPQGLLFDTDIESGQVMNATNLTNLNGIIDNAGVPEGTPGVGMGILMYGLGAMPQYNRPSWDTIIDLEGAWNIEYLYVWLSRNGEIEIQSSQNGVNFDVIATLGASIEQNKWSKVLVNNIFSQGVKFINIAFKKSEHGIKGLLLYGKRSERGEIRGKKYKRTVEARTIDERIGTNAFLLEDKDMVRKVSRHTRCYVESDWVVGRENDVLGEAYDGQGNVIIGVDDVKYQFESQNIWNWDEKLADFQATGQKIMMSTNNAPLYLRPVGYIRADQAKPVDPGLDPVNLVVTTNPQSYKHIARLAYNIAARFGNNPDVDQQYIQLTPTDTLKVGLDVLESLEFRNEADAYWTQANGYHNWEEQAAILSANYDGHKYALGSGFGAKAADPNLKISISSLALGGNIGFLKRMMLWWDLHRGPGDYPFDIINIHHYNGSSGSQTVPIYSDVPSEGVPPEQGEFMEMFTHWCKFRDTQCPKAELRVTEIGYDEQNGGVYSPGYRSQALRSIYKGMWLTRLFLLAFERGFDVVNQFWFANTNVRLEDLEPTGWYRDVFITCGYVDGVTAYNDWNRKPLVSYWYISNLMSEMTGYSYQHTIVLQGQTLANGLIVDTVNPNLNAIAYKNETTGDSIIVAWLGSVGFNIGYIKLYVHPSEGSVTTIALENAELRKDPDGGYKHDVISQSDAAGKYIDLRVTECPIIIKTKNIGTRKLLDPVNFNIEAVSNSVVKLAWTDPNIGGNITKIYQSALPDQGYLEVFSGYIDNGEHIFTELAEGTNYFYKVGFSEGALSSGLSPSIGITTLSTLAAPADLTVVSQTSSSISLGWVYSEANQAKIDQFELYRSLTENGIYTPIATIAKTLRSFTINGLTANTPYFFKIRVKKDFGYSDFTFGLAATTDPVSDLAPVLLDARSNYAGDRIKLIFNRDMANPAGQHTGFSVIENIAGVPNYRSPAALVLDSIDNKIIYLYLSSLISSGGSVLTVTYDKAVASLQTPNGIKLESLTDFYAANNKNSMNLLSKQILVNFTSAEYLANADPSRAEVWNNLLFPSEGEPSDLSHEQKYAPGLKTTTGENSGIDYVGPKSLADAIEFGAVVIPNIHQVNDPFFPPEVNQCGIGIGAAQYGALSAGFFLNLNPAKEYNMRILFTTDMYHLAPRVVNYKSWQAATWRSVDVPGTSVYLTGLKPTTATFPLSQGGGFTPVDHLATPKVGVHARFNETGSYLSAIILEEVTPE